MSTGKSYDVVIIGGGPAGLSAALILGRGRKRVLLCDGGTPRNAVAAHMNGFVSQDGTPPREFRRIAGAQLEKYPQVERRGGLVEQIDGEAGALRVLIDGELAWARRVLICTGMIDELPDTPGYRELWGRSIVQCPYCHGWEVQGQAFGCLLPANAAGPFLEFPLFLRGWSEDLVVLHEGAQFSDELRARYAAAGVKLEERPLRRLISRAAADGSGPQLVAAELDDGTQLPMSVLFARPRQRQVPLVTALALALDEQGFVRVDEHKATSRPGIHAAGDLTTMQQGALVAAAAGAQAAYLLNHALTMEDTARASRRE
jgi:thioredoxin reductase